MVTSIVYAGLKLDRIGRIACITGLNGCGKSRLLGSVFNGLVASHKSIQVPDAAKLWGRAPGGREWIAGGGSGILFANAAKVDGAIAVFRDHNGARVLAPIGDTVMRSPQLDWRQSCELVGTPGEMVADAQGNLQATARGMGQGSALQIVAAARAADVLIFDDIDQHLGPASLRRLVPALRKQLGAQVICTTHNPLLVGLLDPDEVWVMEKRGEGPTARAGIARLSDHPQWAEYAHELGEHGPAQALFWEKSLIEPWVCDIPGSGEATN